MRLKQELENQLESERLKIGQVAKLTSLPVKTIRYYDDLELLSPHVTRNESGYRLFTSQVINRLSFIKRSQSLGLTLEEIKEILSVYDRGEVPCGVAKQLLTDKLAEIEAKIEKLTVLKSELQGIISGWQDLQSVDLVGNSICPNISNQIV